MGVEDGFGGQLDSTHVWILENRLVEKNSFLRYNEKTNKTSGIH